MSMHAVQLQRCWTFPFLFSAPWMTRRQIINDQSALARKQSMLSFVLHISGQETDCGLFNAPESCSESRSYFTVRCFELGSSFIAEKAVLG